MKIFTSHWTTKVYIASLAIVFALTASVPALAQSSAKDMSELEALFFKRVQESKMRFVQADVDFMTHMIPHHSQALIMSRLAPENNASTQVQKLAARIINAQRDEIRTMQTWLRDRGQPVPIVHIDGLNMTIETEMPKKELAHNSDHSMDHSNMDHSTMNHESKEHTSMDHSKHMEAKEKSDHSDHSQSTEKVTSEHEGHPMSGQNDMDHGSMDHSTMDHSTMMGMLTQAELEHLASVKGIEFDKAFLTYMIGHHEGAVYMVNEMFAADGAGNDEDAYRLAVDIYAEQVTEIAMMKLMLQQIDAMVEVKTPHNSHHNH
jgi:uncharacterized protein (DUF305 family)